MHKFKNIQTFESSISGVYSFNTPINKEQIDAVSKGKNYDIYENLEEIVKLSNEILNLDSSEIEKLITDNSDMIERISLSLDNIKQVNNFLISRSK